MFKYICKMCQKDDRNLENTQSKMVFAFISHPRSKSIHTFYGPDFCTQGQDLGSKWDHSLF